MTALRFRLDCGHTGSVPPMPMMFDEIRCATCGEVRRFDDWADEESGAAFAFVQAEFQKRWRAWLN